MSRLKSVAPLLLRRLSLKHEIHLIVGIVFLIFFRYAVCDGQLVPDHPWDELKLFSAGFLEDLALWLLPVPLLFLPGTRIFAFVFCIFVTILSMTNLAVSAHFKAGIVNFRFLWDYADEAGPLFQTGGGLLKFHILFWFLIFPLLYWVLAFRFTRPQYKFRWPSLVRLIRRGKILRCAQNAGMFILIGIFCLWFAEYIRKGEDAENIIGRNALVRMLRSEYMAYKQLQEYRDFASTLENERPDYPDRKTIASFGYRFRHPELPLYKTPPVIHRQPTSKPNIVVIVMESVAAKDTGFRRYNKLPGTNVTPFLNSLMPKSTIVTHFYSNADYTAGAEVASFCSYHDSMRYTVGTGSILRTFTYTKLLCLPEILRDFGYHTMLFHPYTASFDNKNVFFPLNGVREVIDRDDPAYKGLKQTFWGVQDIEMFRNGAKVLTKRKKPFFAFFLTVSNHPPYILHHEEDRQNFGQEGRYEDYLNTVFQTDRAIQEFFTMARKESWFKNTIVLITSDNGILVYPDKLRPLPFATTFKMWHLVPFLLYSENPAYNLRGRVLDLKAASHIDITPTILDLMGVDIPNHFVGQSVFSRNRLGAFLAYDWFGNYYRVSMPYIYHATDRTYYNLRTEKQLSMDPEENDRQLKWVRDSVKFYNILTFKNLIWTN